MTDSVIKKEIINVNTASNLSVSWNAYGSLYRGLVSLGVNKNIIVTACWAHGSSHIPIYAMPQDGVGQSLRLISPNNDVTSVDVKYIICD